MDHPENKWLNRSMWGMAVVVFILAAVVVIRLIGPPGTCCNLANPAPTAAPAAGNTSGTVGNDTRLASCPVTTIAGIDLDCLGSKATKTAEHKPTTHPKKGTIVVMWAYWCGPCHKELPVVERFARLHPEYTVIGVHADSRSQAGADWLAAHVPSLPSLADPTGRLTHALSLPGLVPLTVVVRPDGSKAGVITTPAHSPEELARKVAALL